MAAIVWSDVTAYVSALSTIDPVQQADLLAMANKSFVAIFDGEDGTKTRMARIYYVAHFASQPGSGDQRAGGAVIGQTRGGLSQQYAPPPGGGADPMWATTQWGQRLELMLAGSRAAWPRTP
jgi:hypothetical protein